MANKVIDDTNVGRLVSDIKSKADATYWPISDTEEVSLATVATTGSYNDLTDKPTVAGGALIYVGTCATAAATATKVVTTETFPLQNGLPVVGTVIAVKFTNTNTASVPKLDVNETGAISIYYNTSVATSSSASYGGTADRYVYYMYDGTNWCWLSYGTDANDNTVGYNIRTNATRKTVSGACYRYRLLFTSKDGTQWVPSNTSTSTSGTAAKAVNQDKIDPFGPIVYYGTTTAVSSGGAPSATYLYEQYSSLTFGYAFNRTGAALVLTTQTPVYLKCAPQTDGSAIIDADTPYVQALPTTEDGKIYIFLGNAITATTVELLLQHPIYYFKDGAIRQWTNAAAGGGGIEYFDVTTSTSFAQIKAAYDAGKYLRLIDDNSIAPLVGYVYNEGTGTGAAAFCYTGSGSMKTYTVLNNGSMDIWDTITKAIPEISTSITADATSDTKTASPKAVKTYVDAQVGDIATLLATI